VTDLDFSIFPVITEMDVIWKLPSDELKIIPDIYEKAVAAQYMLFNMSDEPKSKNVTLQVSASAHFRAALVEFAGIEDVLNSHNFDFKIRNLKILPIIF